jgi:hypothetical protein
MRYRRFSILIVVFLFLPLTGFTLPQLAILEAMLAAGIDPTVGPLVTSKIEEEFVNSGKYTVLDRANIDQVLREKEFQLSSGIVRNEEVRQAGEYLGADYIVSVTVSRVGQTFVVAAKMIDVVSGEIAAQTSYERQGRIDVLLDIAKVVGVRLAGTEIVMIEVEEPEAEEPEVEKPEEVEVEVTPKVEPVVRPPREREPVAFKRYVVGVKGGGNLATALTKTWADWDYWGYDSDWSVFHGGHFSDEWPYAMFGLNVGAYFILYLGNYLGIQTELLYSQKGYKYDFEDFDFVGTSLGLVTNLFKFSYIEFPILLKARLPGRFSPYAVVGASFGVLLGVTVDNIYDSSFSQTFYDSFWGSEPFDLIEWGWEYNTLDAGLVAGTGIDILFGALLLNLEVRYTLGLLAVTPIYEYTNGAFSFTGGVGYQF